MSHKFGHRDQSLRDLLSDENMNRTVPNREEFEVQMDNTGAATIFTPKGSEKKTVNPPPYLRAKEKEWEGDPDEESPRISDGTGMRVLRLQSTVSSGRDGDNILARRHLLDPQASEKLVTPQVSKEGKRLTL